jgi:ribosomal protein S12 methylthiotransferase
VDSEIMLGTLLKDGIQLTNDTTEADVVIVNTCSFIDAAQEESVDTILESAAVRDASHRGQGLVVAGCLPQRFRDDLPRLMPEVDAFMGIDQVSKVTEIVREAAAGRARREDRRRRASRGRKPAILARFATLDQRAENKQPGNDSHQIGKHNVPGPSHGAAGRLSNDAPILDVNARPKYIPNYATPRFRLTPPHFAYVKIAEGCNHPCSFCIIPRMRGTHRSRQQGDVVAEARALLADGVKELNLISQDSTYYGLDLRPNHSRSIAAPQRFRSAVQELPRGSTTICTLLRELNELPGDFWIRLLYTHPAHWTDELIQTIHECPKVARYVDIPLQHIHENMLERMRRETTRQHIVDLLRRIRSGVPGIALRTTFIVGFPGETEECFECLLEFIRVARFDRLGVFAYSQEEGTRAGAMAGQIPDAVKKKRRDRAMAVQHELAISIGRTFVGRTLRVLVEKRAGPKDLQGVRISSWEHGLIRESTAQGPGGKKDYFVARGEADAPDIDGRVYVGGEVAVGQFAQVQIIGCTDYDLIAEPIRS